MSILQFLKKIFDSVYACEGSKPQLGGMLQALLGE